MYITTKKWDQQKLKS